MIIWTHIHNRMTAFHVSPHSYIPTHLQILISNLKGKPIASQFLFLISNIMPFQILHAWASLLQSSPRISIPIWLCGASCHQCWHCLPSDPWEIWWRWWHSGLWLPVKADLRGKISIHACGFQISLGIALACSVLVVLSWLIFTQSPVN